jgi:diguanylate cyclase (GGDEF)-like protein
LTEGGRSPATIAAPGGFDPPAYAALMAQAEAAQAAGDYGRGAALAGEAALLAAHGGREREQARACLLQATQLQRTGATEPAARAGERACALFAAVGDQPALCEALTDLTLIYVLLGLHDEALASVTTSLHIAQELGDNRLLYWAYNRIGVVRNAQGDPEQAEEYMLRALELAASLGPPERFCILNNLADNAHDLVPLLRARGDVAEAAHLAQGIRHAEAAIALTDAVRQPYQRALAGANLGLLRAFAGAFEAAAESLAAAAAVAHARGYENLVRMTQHFTAQMELMQKNYPAAIAGLTEVLAQAMAGADRLMAARINKQLSDAYAAANQPEQALLHYKNYHALERDFNSAVAQTRARLLSNMFELEASKREALRSRLEAERLRSQSLALFAEKQALELEADQLRLRAEQDALTGLWNRRHVDATLPALCARSRAEARPLCLGLCDIDRFKSVNDRFGHAMGDKVLAQIARLLAAGARGSDIVARIGGEEFLLVFLDADVATAARICERLRAKVESFDWATFAPGLAVTISIGLSGHEGGQDVATALKAVDQLLYAAKQGGRNQVCVSTGPA